MRHECSVDDPPGYYECNFDLPESMVLGVAIYTDDMVDSNFDIAWEREASDGREVSSIGDGAFLTDAPGDGRLLLARVHGLGVRVLAGDLNG